MIFWHKGTLSNQPGSRSLELVHGQILYLLIFTGQILHGVLSGGDRGWSAGSINRGLNMVVGGLMVDWFFWLGLL